MQRRIIKKYANRRLYDTTRGGYITLDDIKKLVFDHADFEVIDAQSKKDLTKNTLLQIILAEESHHATLFTNAMLQDFIRFYQQKSQHVFSEYLEQAMALFIQQKEFFNHQLKSYQALIHESLQFVNKKN